ncbi:unnamed protein product, partial [Rotaria magnacalcarata]
GVATECSSIGVCVPLRFFEDTGGFG